MDVLTRTLNSMVLSEQHAAKRYEIEMNVLRYLSHGDRTIRQIAEYLDLRDRAARGHLARLLYEKKIHISGWERIHQMFSAYHPLLRLGAGDNVPYPRENNNHSLERDLMVYTAKVEGEDGDIVIKRPPTVVNVRRDELVEALFGKAK